MGRNFLTVRGLGADGIQGLVARSVEYASGRLQTHRPLTGKTVGIYFAVSSTRTRTSFTVGAQRLGAQTITYGPSDLQIATGETLQDTGRVLAEYLDALVVRTNSDVEAMEGLSAGGRLAVINAMSSAEHPTQAIADLSALQEHFGALEGLHVLYVGEGNNSAAALALAISQVPRMKVTLVTPKGYGLADEVLRQASIFADDSGSEVVHHHDSDALPRSVDAVYATRWQTMGVTKSESDWKESFRALSVTEALMERVSKGGTTVFMHDLPAVRGDDVVDAVLDGAQSIAWRQAAHKLFGAMAVLEWVSVSD